MKYKIKYSCEINELKTYEVPINIYRNIHNMTDYMEVVSLVLTTNTYQQKFLGLKSILVHTDSQNCSISRIVHPRYCLEEIRVNCWIFIDGPYKGDYIYITKNLNKQDKLRNKTILKAVSTEHVRTFFLGTYINIYKQKNRLEKEREKKPLDKRLLIEKKQKLIEQGTLINQLINTKGINS